MVTGAGVSLRGSVVVITGAAGGLGSAYARECARRGAAVLLTDTDQQRLQDLAEEISARGGVARSLPGDVSDLAHMRQVADLAVRTWGRVSGWINNAGVQLLQAIDEIEADAVENMVRVNLLGSLYGTGCAAAVMKRQGFGSIVNVTSGAQLGMEHLAAYGATKGAIASLTYATALELQADGIRVNAISPLAATRMTLDGDSYMSGLAGRRIDATSRLQDPAACAALPAFLVSDAAAAITGQVIRFDGMTLSLMRRPGVMTESSLTREAWAAEDVQVAFDTSLEPLLVTPDFRSPARDSGRDVTVPTAGHPSDEGT